MTIIERTLSFLITLLLYSRPKKEGTTSHVYGKRQTEICTTWPSFPFPCRLLFFLYLLKYRALGCVSSLKSEIALKIRIWILVKKHTLRFFDEDDYEYEIFSILSIAQAWTSVILAGKRDSRRHSTTSFSEEVVVAGTSYQVIKWRLPFAVNVILNLSNNYSWLSIERIPKRSRNSIHNWSMVRTEFWMENSGLFPYFF